MDFSIDSPHQEEFRHEVRAWLAEHLTDELKLPEVRREETVDLEKIKAFRRKLAEKGWAAPTWSGEWGGGGLTSDLASVIEEELFLAGAAPWPGTVGLGLIAPAVWIWGTEEQKRRFIPMLIRGEAIFYQLFTEPDAGSDLASMKTRAVRDGDDFIITGVKHFNGNAYRPEWFWLLAVTDPDGPRHHNIGAFLIPADLPGVTVETMDLVISEVKRRVYLDGVRVSRQSLIGGETNGWAVSQSTLEMEHGNHGAQTTRASAQQRVDQLMEYARVARRRGRQLCEDPQVQRSLLDYYVQAQVTRLFSLRNQWMYHAKQPMAHHGSQFMIQNKTLSFVEAQAILEVAGPYASMLDPVTAPNGGLVRTPISRGAQQRSPSRHDRDAQAHHLAPTRARQAFRAPCTYPWLLAKSEP
jgi:alkylation response protein AidB-like acyl-CoA dehydrogenase